MLSLLNLYMDARKYYACPMSCSKDDDTVQYDASPGPLGKVSAAPINNLRPSLQQNCLQR